jgi:putative membrane protein insertion efficiency factor
MKKVLLSLIKFYQNFQFLKKPIFKTLFISEGSCKFIPTCSEYTYQAVKKYGSFKGFLLGLKRILKCHPWSKGGKDELK